MTTHTMTIQVHRTNLLTANQRLHWATRARMTRVLREKGSMSARAFGLPVMSSAVVNVYVTYPDRRARDVANLHPTAKAVIDGVVSDAKRLPNDTDEHLKGPFLWHDEGRTTRYPGLYVFRFEFEEVEAA